jgi:hypothetical protein
MLAPASRVAHTLLSAHHITRLWMLHGHASRRSYVISKDDWLDPPLEEWSNGNERIDDLTTRNMRSRANRTIQRVGREERTRSASLLAHHTLNITTVTIVQRIGLHNSETYCNQRGKTILHSTRARGQGKANSSLSNNARWRKPEITPSRRSLHSKLRSIR